MKSALISFAISAAHRAASAFIRPRIALAAAAIGLGGLTVFSLTGCAAPAPLETASAQRPLLAPAGMVGGLQPIFLQARPSGTVPEAGGATYVRWQHPTLAAGRNGFLYVFDAGRRQIYRYDPMQQSMTRFHETLSEGIRSMAVASDLSLYVADANARQVNHYSWDGRLLRSFSSSLELGQPVAIVLDEPHDRLYVADGLFNRVVVFNSFGLVLSVIRPLESHGIEAMAVGADALYLVDRASRQVVALGMDGKERIVFGAEVLKDPVAIAIDRFNRVYVADQFDDRIKIFEGGKMIAAFGRQGSVPGAFHRITGLSIELNTLYVSDSLNARVQMFSVVPPENRGP